MVTFAAALLTVAFAAPADKPAAPASAAPKTVTLSQRDVAELVLKQSLTVKEITADYESRLAAVTTARSVLDWNLTIETGHTKSSIESLTKYFNPDTDQTLRTSASVSKSLLTGTSIKLDLVRDSFKTDRLVSPGTTPNDIVADNYLLSVEQPLWRNFFGASNRASIANAEYTYEASIGLRANDLEDAVLKALRLYWDTYVQQESFRESLAVRDRYEKLVASVRRKTSVGYNSPGELSQAQAELENRNQLVKTNSLSYLASLDSLITLLNLEPKTDIVFAVPKDLPPVPKLAEKPLEELRAIRAQELSLKAAQEALNKAESDAKPGFALVGRLGATGVEETAESSYAELTSGRHPQTYIGVKFQYDFGSGKNAENVRAARAQLALAEARLARTRNEERDVVASFERKVGAQYAIAQSAARQRNFREKAMQELTRTYNQGRTNLRDLIEAMNQYFDSEVKMIRALGDYQIALNEWAAARDELIPDQKASKP